MNIFKIQQRLPSALLVTAMTKADRYIFWH